MKAYKLKKGNKIGVCAPSGIIEEKHKKDFEKSEILLSEYNLEVIYSKNIFSKSLKYSSTPSEKSLDLNELVLDDDIKAIIFAKGGSNSNSILTLINYENIKKYPKMFIGFSDNSILLNAIYKKTGLVTYHFTNYKGFCEKNIEFNKNQFENVFINGNKGKVVQNSSWKILRKGKATGKLIGGNLSSIVKILNTEYFPNIINNILFIEDLSYESNIEMVSSYLYQLKNSKVFEKISGLLIGNYDSQENTSFEEVVMEITNEYDFPILKCDDFGHTSTNIVIPIGIKCTLDANNGELVYEENTAK